MARRKKQQKPEPEQPVFTEQEIRYRTRWLLFNFDMETGRYLSTPPWEHSERKECGNEL